ncbi:unnamed protein product [Dracunculus medinensis]|uniref:Neuropeptide-Like Protein n=1 Tax=Dracunculus medinensis TaxID=318479 RepID=A0A0N4UCN7_DRAME|nr:unnamed protein product [Dracunculus medinensis]
MLYITLTILLTAVFINLVRPSSYHVDELDYDDQLMRNAERQKLSVLLIPILMKPNHRREMAWNSLSNLINERNVGDVPYSSFPVLKRNIAIGRGDGFRPGK